MSPRTTWLSQVTYWIGTGLSSPYFARVAASAAGSRLSPASASAGSPGSARTPTKIRTLESASTISAAPTRRRRKERIA